jgi:hypothetical protein
MIVRVLRRPDGTVNRTVLDHRAHDGQQAITEIKKLIEAYPEHGYAPEEGYWARDAAGNKYTFEG